MVGYGSSLRKARRIGWESTYLDYDGMKCLLSDLDENISLHHRASMKFTGIEYNESIGLLETGLNLQYTSAETKLNICETSDYFLQMLRREVEKVSLYTIKRQGEIADALGDLRFSYNAPKGERKEPLWVEHNSERGFFRSISDDDVSGEAVLSSAAEETLIDDLAALLPKFKNKNVELNSSMLRQAESLKPSGPRPMFRGSGIFQSAEIMGSKDETYYDSDDEWVPIDNNSTNNDADVQEEEGNLGHYTILAVELLHLLRYICVNAMAMRKIIKKYDKTMEKILNISTSDDFYLQDETKHYENENARFVSPLATGSLQDHHEKHVEQLQQLATSKSIEAITASIMLASGQSQRQNFDNLNLRFKCAIDCIDILREYADVMNHSFPVFLSRRAMIVTGQELGDLGSMKLKALKVILKFDPDTILLMDQMQLIEWQDKCWAFSSGVGKRLRSTSFEDVDIPGAPIDQALQWGGANNVAIIINLISTLLYSVNYYIVSPTANRYAILLGSDGAFGSALIGASSLAAFLAAFLYSWWYTRFSFKSALIWTSLCAVIGNILYAVAISFHSMKIALMGRFFVGLGSAEVVNRQLISSCVHYNHMTKASAGFVAASAVGMGLGPFLAALLDDLAGRDSQIDYTFPPWVPYLSGVGIVYDHVTSPAFFMAAVWFLLFGATIILFEEPIRINCFKRSNNDIEKGLISQIKTVIDLLFRNSSLPVTLFIYCYIELVDEVLISSCAMVCKRYFNWHGSVAGYILAALGGLVLPADFISEKVSKLYEERVIMKHLLSYICVGLVLIINYQGLFVDFDIVRDNTTNLLQNATMHRSNSVGSLLEEEMSFPYDWYWGAPIYLFALSLVFMATVVLEGVDMSLMSISAPPELNSTFFSTGLLATLVGTLGRCFGDSIITLSAMCDRLQYVDFLNYTFIPLIPMSLCGLYLVKRYYTSLTYQ